MSNPDVIQYPRAVVSLSLTVSGDSEPVDVLVIPRRVMITRRSHTQADTCEVTLDGIDLPFDPRAIGEVILAVHLADVRDAGAGTMNDGWRTPATQRFLGMLDTFDDEQDDDDVLTLRARDLSSILRDAKPLPTDAVPRYSDTLGEAIRRILAAVPGADTLSVEENGEENTPLRPTVAGRVQSGAAVHVENNWSAWEVIEHTAGLTAHLVTVVNDRIVLRLGSQAYANNDAPAVVLGFNSGEANLSSLAVEKKFVRNRKGIRVVSFDVISRTTIEADWPDDGTLRQLHPTRARATGRSGRSGAAGHGRSSRPRAAPKPPDRDVLLVANVTSQDALRDIARQVWEERSRQELTVKAATPYFTDPFLNLRNGARVRVELNRALAAGLNLTQPTAQQVAFVRRRLQVSTRVAKTLVNLARLQQEGASTDLFYVHEVQLSWDAGDAGEGGDCGVKLELINLIPVEAR